MNEKEFRGFKTGYESTVVARSMATPDVCEQAKEDYLRADIARQLTRIADAQEQIANPLIQVDKDGMMRPVPTPDVPTDALVEAVKKMIAKFEAAIKTDDVFAKGLPAQMFLGDTIELAKKVQSLLPDHEKAVR